MFNHRAIKVSREYPYIVQFLKALEAAGYPAICAGGFPRDVGIGEPYKDIDIFVQVKDESEEVQGKIITIKLNCKLLPPIHSRIQTICVPCDDIITYINQSFDFTCCLAYIASDGDVYVGNALESLNSMVLRFVDGNRNSFDSIKSARHCLRLLDKGWTASTRVVKALIRTMVPVVGSQTYANWNMQKEVLDRILSSEFERATVGEQRPIVSMREYEVERPVEQTQQTASDRLTQQLMEQARLEIARRAAMQAAIQADLTRTNLRQTIGYTRPSEGDTITWSIGDFNADPSR